MTLRSIPRARTANRLTVACLAVLATLAVVARVVFTAPAPARAADQVAAQPTGPVVGAKPAYDWVKVDEHKQLYGMSCIPMTVEMVLKLLSREPADYYALQEAWKEKADGTFGDFDNRTVAGVTFYRQFFLPRDEKFPLDDLFHAIDAELAGGRHVIVSLLWDRAYHMFVIVDRSAAGEYRAVSKAGAVTIEVGDVKARIKSIQGTDILTYTIEPVKGAKVTPEPAARAK